jgi:hypothetical protein
MIKNFLQASKNGVTKNVISLIHAGAELNHQDNVGYTPLIFGKYC